MLCWMWDSICKINRRLSILKSSENRNEGPVGVANLFDDDDCDVEDCEAKGDPISNYKHSCEAGSYAL